MRKKYNTPHRSRVVKTRLSEDEYADFTARLAPYGISQSEFLRQAIRRATIRPVVHVSSVNDELLSAVGKLTAEYGRIGGNFFLCAGTSEEDMVFNILQTAGGKLSDVPLKIGKWCNSSNVRGALADVMFYTGEDVPVELPSA